MREGIFICYRRRDSAALAGRLYDTLSDWFPNRIYMDAESISPGLDFKKRIQSIMQKCGVVIALIGPQWAPPPASLDGEKGEEDFVLSELEQAISCEVTVIPILLDGTKMPSLSEMPQSIRSLKFHHALDIRTHCFSRDILPLRIAVCEHLGLRLPTPWEGLAARIQGWKSVDEDAREFNAGVCIWSAGISAFGLLSEHTFGEVFILVVLSL